MSSGQHTRLGHLQNSQNLPFPSDRVERSLTSGDPFSAAPVNKDKINSTEVFRMKYKSKLLTLKPYCSRMRRKRTNKFTNVRPRNSQITSSEAAVMCKLTKIRFH